MGVLHATLLKTSEVKILFKSSRTNLQASESGGNSWGFRVLTWCHK